MESQQIPLIRVTEVGEFIRHNSCERRFKLAFNNRKEAKRLPFAERLFNVLDPVLQAAGDKREEDWERSLRDGYDFTCLNSIGGTKPQLTWGEFVAAVSQLPLNTNAYAREVELSGPVGGFLLQGRIDFIVITWEGDTPKIRLVECKASRRDRTYHKVQVSLYKLLFEQLIQSVSLSIQNVPILAENLECVVARIDESTNESQSILQLPPLDLEIILDDVCRLLESNGHLKRALDTSLDSLDYKLEAKCDGCVFNVDCLPESARQRKLQLIGLDPSDIRTMRTHGVTTIDDLASLDLTSPEAELIRQSPNFTGGLDVLVAKAQARQSTLPKENPQDQVQGYQVVGLPNRWASQLPEHEIEGDRLVRVYLSVDYDYTENRIGALSAHVTKSVGKLKTNFLQDGDKWAPDPTVVESDGLGGHSTVSGKDVIRFKTSSWTGRIEEDNGSEKELIQSFIHELLEAISEIASDSYARVHFYVWSRSEMAHLVEGCTRGGSDLLGHIKELLGCRESLEQLIFSSVSEEVRNRFSLGWSGQGLAIVSSLRWFGDTYHWTRIVIGKSVELDKVFTQDIFDFKTDLALKNGSWADSSDSSAKKYKFEIRSRFNDSLPAPYWHAVWGTLPNPDDKSIPHNLRNAIKRYNGAATPNYLRSYLKARVHALRWVEEHIGHKNKEIIKPKLNVNELLQFSLGVDSVAASAIDFLQLEQHIKVSQWVSVNLASPSNRVLQGRTIPLKNIRAIRSNKAVAEIDLNQYDIDSEELSSRSMIHEGSFSRVIPYKGDPNNPQTVKQLHRLGSTCVVERIDWDVGTVELSIIPMRSSYADQYRLASYNYDPGHTEQFATLDESPSDYVTYRVAKRLTLIPNSSSYRWFDPVSPRLPEQKELDENTVSNLLSILKNITFTGGYTPSDDQALAVINGLDTTVQLIQGPPGTGKTQTTAVAILLRSTLELQLRDIVLVVGNTHTAVDNLLARIYEVKGPVDAALKMGGLSPRDIVVAKVHSSKDDKEKKALQKPIENLNAEACTADITRLRKNGVLILGGTTSALLKMAENVEKKKAFESGFFANLLVVDEASMMVFPNFLALTSLLNDDSKAMLSGDHRQLAPILTHDWEKEDRPPVVLYQPFFSAYDAVNSLTGAKGVTERSVKRSALEYTYRLPPIVRSLIGQLYRKDEIELQGLSKSCKDEACIQGNPWGKLWGGAGLFLVVHNERESRKRNPIEAEIIHSIISSGVDLEQGSIAVITPHRAQRTLLKGVLDGYSELVPIIDTVERLQGDQKQTIIISATASDPIAIAASVEFILDLNRSNVAFSRVQNRLIVVCSDALLSHMAPESEQYESAILWKTLRSICNERVSSIFVGDFVADVYTPDADKVEELSQ